VYVLVAGCFGVANEKSKTIFLGDSGDMGDVQIARCHGKKLENGGKKLVLVKMESLYVVGS
jgi:hypothetical protein